jgi:cyanophycin synthetase
MSTIDLSRLSFNFQLLLKALQYRKIQLRYISETNVVQASYQNHVEYLFEGLTRLIPSVYLPILDDKFYAKKFMKDHGFSVIPGMVFSPEERKEAIAYTHKIGYPVVLKPTDSTNGDLAFVNLPDEKSFIEAFNEFARYTHTPNMLVEKFFVANDYRFLVMGDKDIAVVRRTLPYVRGDGQSTIRQLVEKENNRRMNPRATCLCPIYIDDSEGRRILRQQGLSSSSILPQDQTVTLRCNANVCWGGECQNALDIVHPSYLILAKKIHHLFPGSGYTSVDLLIHDPSLPALADNYVFCEFNSTPGLSLHLMPSAGKSHDVLNPIIDLLFPETAYA